MRTGSSIAVVVALALSGCAAMADGEGDDLMLRVRISGAEIASVEVVDRAAPGDLDDQMRPQMSGDVGIIWTDYESGETLADGWMPPMQVDQTELYLVVPAPGSEGALLTVTVPTDSGPFVLTSYFAP